MESKSVAIIGAGSSGLVAANVLLKDGFDVTIFERGRHIGGIWCEDCAYVDLHSQQFGGTIEFSDLFDGEEFASWQHIHDYLKRYADHCHLTERIKFRTRVIEINKKNLKDGNIPWQIKVEKFDGQYEMYEFDFLVIATSLFNEVYMPYIRGQEKFEGRIIHGYNIKSHEQLIDKRVVIIGGGKCATDLASICGSYTRSCHIVLRRAHWMLPRTIAGGLLPARYLLTRLAYAAYGPFPGAPHSKLFRYFHRTFPRLFTFITDKITADIMAINGPDLYDDKVFLPNNSFRNAENIYMIPQDFIRLRQQGRIIAKLDSIDEIIDSTTIRLKSGEHLQADMIICATGFITRFPFFSDMDAKILVCLTQWLVAEVTSHWVSEYFLGRLKLPVSEAEMYKEIDETCTFIHKTFNRTGCYLMYYWLSPIEIYLKDMGLRLERTHNWISEYFGIYRPERFKGLHEERRAKAAGIKYHHWYFGFQHTILILFFLLLLMILLL
ncbi:unnamed protein product [Rotaria sp. Silwood1]|nr:unnamed protein product [Rotaria sp. Silwood1]CAF1624030.1 unnamed protein product [Rotaria sp. Silwood1]CAF3794196.1 unnamed protein product [Rotaria sp. Silwood1]CAF3818384.1 unnamed protein product [Rotaria sp. Silwood1]CAF4761334.1 unnamed protein product [Rotaria sp. Silwood1]